MKEQQKILHKQLSEFLSPKCLIKPKYQPQKQQKQHSQQNFHTISKEINCQKQCNATKLQFNQTINNKQQMLNNVKRLNSNFSQASIKDFQIQTDCPRFRKFTIHKGNYYSDQEVFSSQFKNKILANTFETTYYSDFSNKSPILKQIEYAQTMKNNEQNSKDQKKIQFMNKKIKTKLLSDYFQPKLKLNQIINENEIDTIIGEEKMQDYCNQKETENQAILEEDKIISPIDQANIEISQEEQKEEECKTPLSQTQEETTEQQSLKAFEEFHKDYFLHLSGKCKCVVCDCGKCKCDYGKKNRILPGALQEISEYQKAFEQNNVKDALQKKIGEYQTLMSNFSKIKETQEKANAITRQSIQKTDFKRHSSESYLYKLNKPLSNNLIVPMLYKQSKYQTDFLNFGASPVNNYSKNNQSSNIFPPVSINKESLYQSSYKQFDGRDGRMNISQIHQTNPIDFSQIPFFSSSQYRDTFKPIDASKDISKQQITEKNNLFSYQIRQPLNQFKTVSQSSFVSHNTNICPAMFMK